MNVVQIISKKRDGGELSSEEIGALIHGYVRGDVHDYQMSAWAMAVYLRGMTVAETAALTEHMLNSGVTFQWPAGEAPKVDKHSTGGVGDKISLPLAPLLACCDVQVPMISGRGLGATGGTLDKLESIPGFRTDLSTEEMQSICRRVGCVISGATDDLVPADRKLYALRDVTGTVPSIPLITASIMSKKLAEGLDALVLDVKYGSGAFMKTLDQARELAHSMVDTGKRMGVPTAALLTDMNQPLGRTAGNAVEVNESIDVLKGEGPNDVFDLTLVLGAELLVLAKRDTTLADAMKRLQRAIDTGAGLEKFREMVAAQGGDLDATRPVALAQRSRQPTRGLYRGDRHRIARSRDHRARRRSQEAWRQARLFGRPGNACTARRSGRRRTAACAGVCRTGVGSQGEAVDSHRHSNRRRTDRIARFCRGELRMNTDRQQLIQAALDAQKRAYCPYSNFPVGAAIQTASGKVYEGVNVENASFGLTLCAERVAASAAVAAGDRDLAAIAIASRGGATPCGACRQFLAEFNPALPITIVDSDQPTAIRQTTLDLLLPSRFEGPIQ